MEISTAVEIEMLGLEPRPADQEKCDPNRVVNNSCDTSDRGASDKKRNTTSEDHAQVEDQQSKISSLEGKSPRKKIKCLSIGSSDSHDDQESSLSTKSDHREIDDEKCGKVESLGVANVKERQPSDNSSSKKHAKLCDSDMEISDDVNSSKEEHSKPRENDINLSDDDHDNDDEYDDCSSSNGYEDYSSDGSNNDDCCDCDKCSYNADYYDNYCDCDCVECNSGSSSSWNTINSSSSCNSSISLDDCLLKTKKHREENSKVKEYPKDYIPEAYEKYLSEQRERKQRKLRLHQLSDSSSSSSNNFHDLSDDGSLDMSKLSIKSRSPLKTSDMVLSSCSSPCSNESSRLKELASCMSPRAGSPRFDNRTPSPIAKGLGYFTVTPPKFQKKTNKSRNCSSSSSSSASNIRSFRTKPSKKSRTEKARLRSGSNSSSSSESYDGNNASEYMISYLDLQDQLNWHPPHVLQDKEPEYRHYALPDLKIALEVLSKKKTVYYSSHSSVSSDVEDNDPNDINLSPYSRRQARRRRRRQRRQPSSRPSHQPRMSISPDDLRPLSSSCRKSFSPPIQPSKIDTNMSQNNSPYPYQVYSPLFPKSPVKLNLTGENSPPSPKSSPEFDFTVSPSFAQCSSVPYILRPLSISPTISRKVNENRNLLQRKLLDPSQHDSEVTHKPEKELCSPTSKYSHIPTIVPIQNEKFDSNLYSVLECNQVDSPTSSTSSPKLNLQGDNSPPSPELSPEFDFPISKSPSSFQCSSKNTQQDTTNFIPQAVKTLLMPTPSIHDNKMGTGSLNTMQDTYLKLFDNVRQNNDEPQHYDILPVPFSQYHSFLDNPPKILQDSAQLFQNKRQNENNEPQEDEFVPPLNQFHSFLNNPPQIFQNAHQLLKSPLQNVVQDNDNVEIPLDLSKSLSDEEWQDSDMNSKPQISTASTSIQPSTINWQHEYLNNEAKSEHNSILASLRRLSELEIKEDAQDYNTTLNDNSELQDNETQISNDSTLSPHEWQDSDIKITPT